MFQPVESSVSFPKLEEEVARFWKDRAVYEKSLAARSDGPAFVFYEGPPTANGLPHPGHCLTRAIKDLFPRYRTMRGYNCQRKAGWDTHGLPVEVEVCKEMGIHSKEEIEAFGVEPFIRKCLESVFRYTREWEQLTERLGFWIHLDEAYVTYHQSYVESVWWALKSLFDRGLLYQGYKIVWWWAQGGTALSSGEVGQGYREVADPSVFVRFPLVSPLPLGEGQGEGLRDVDLLVWTTTPWTLPSNQFAAVKPDLEYSIVSVEGDSRKLVLASALVETVSQKANKKFEVVATLPGEQLLGLRYVPPFRHYYDLQGDKQGRLKEGGSQHTAWRVVPADFVTTDTGTGIVHQAPAFGEVDFDLLQAEHARFVDGEGPSLICSVAADGTFTADTPEYKGRWVKDCDRDIIRQLKTEGKLFHQEQYLHDYPFCWRAEEDPLIQYPRKSWFIRTTAFKEKMLENNSHINWLPEHIKEGRFGNFLETNVDWALSRERYWGTPLPIWKCNKTGYTEAVGSYTELLAKPDVQGVDVWENAKRENPELADDLKVHKPYIDAITYASPKAKDGRMERVSEVIDCWFDSGAMPFAQWGYPHKAGSAERFRDQFPADFISEALDQTRGWFYSQLAISTLMFSENDETKQGLGDSAPRGNGQIAPASFPYPHPFRNCIVLGLMLGEDGQKMSKSKRNYRDPGEIFDLYGADALRWYFFANQPPWTSIRYSEQAIKDCIPEFLLRLWNVYSFFVIYANIDGFDPAAALRGAGVSPDQLSPEVLAKAKGYRPVADRGELDRWILSELSRTVRGVVQCMDAYDNFNACTRLTEFVDALSNWYVRRSRDRFWSSGRAEDSADKTDAYWTLYECLLTTCKLIAPFVPFLAETMWQNLAVAAFGDNGERQPVAESVHLCDYPTADLAAIDEELSTRMTLMREVVSLGRSARMGAKLKVRQPLSRVEVVLADSTHQPWLEEHASLICDELNVKEVEFVGHAEQYITYTVLPDLKRLGPKLGKRLPALRKALAAAHAAKLLADLEATGGATLSLPDGPVTLGSEDIQVRLQAKDGWAAAQGRAVVVVLSTELTDELIREGLARDFVRALQETRKELGFQFTDRINVRYETESVKLPEAVSLFIDYIKSETLSVQLGFERIDVAIESGRGGEGVKSRGTDVAGESVTFWVWPAPLG
ncbi:MAG: isoleucine--tRNA ligase [Planctomycetaceae bacterium]|nr:isoleucine--tRNA ligase [Planctomycetaceae bacterium]